MPLGSGKCFQPAMASSTSTSTTRLDALGVGVSTTEAMAARLGRPEKSLCLGSGRRFHVSLLERVVAARPVSMPLGSGRCFHSDQKERGRGACEVSMPLGSGRCSHGSANLAGLTCGNAGSCERSRFRVLAMSANGLVKHQNWPLTCMRAVPGV